MSRQAPNDFSYLSDEDVKLLYEIITAAEVSVDPPFRALFAAYDQVLTRYGISKDHDQLYFRFLLRMGEGRKEGEGIFERFESLLTRLGFQIDFVPEGEEGGEAARMQNREEHGKRRKSARSRSPLQDRKTTRRASFDSAYDTIADTRRSSIAGMQDSPPRPHSTDIDHGRNRARSNGISKTAISPDIPCPQQAPLNSSRGRVNTKRGRARRENNVSQRHVSVSRSSHVSRKPLPRPVNGDEDSSGMDSGTELSNEVRDDQLIRVPKVPASYQEPAHKPHNLPQMESYANTLRYHHLAATAIRIFRDWSSSAISANNQHERMYEVASARDAETLARQAFEQWHIALLEKQQQQETDVFFEALETKATKARDLFLLTKAFTHWAQCASEQVLRTSAARRHILRTRYFIAWRDITVVNELKVRRKGLHKFLSIWKRRTAQVIRQQDKAVLFEARREVARFYRRWFWHFCERRAPLWYELKLKKNMLKRWVEVARHVQSMKTWAVDSRADYLLRQFTVTWARRSDVVQRIENEAQIFRRQNILQPAVDILQKELILSPLQTELVQTVDTRIARSVFATWSEKVQVSMRSARLCNLRILRNTWTQWNDRLRCQTLSRTIDDRIILRVLYRWVLAERLALCLRVRNEKSRRSVFSDWRARTNNLSAALGKAKHLILQHRNSLSCSAITATWSSKAAATQILHNRADQFRNQNLAVRAMGLWTEKLRHVEQLQTWSVDARFYVLISRSLKSWQATTISNKRARRRQAYAAIRRKVKTALARKLLLKWQTNTTLILSMNQHAEALDQYRLITLGSSLFSTWTSRAHLHNQQSSRASTFHTTRLQQMILQLLHTHHNTIALASSRANTFLLDTRDTTAANCLRKLNWTLFQAKRRQETAQSLEVRTGTRHYRNMLRYWAERATQSLQVRKRVNGFAEGDDAVMTEDGDGAETAVDEFEDDALPLFVGREVTGARTGVAAMAMAQVQATPGYLRTPSRRSGKGSRLQYLQTQTQMQIPMRMGMGMGSLGTPGTVQATPFIDRLRGRGGFGSAREGFGTRRVVEEGFEDVPRRR